MNAFIRELVHSRAKNSCEYCRLPKHALPSAAFHIEHILARQHGGTDDPENLALACDRCNAFKGPNLASIDPTTRMVTMLFNPRQQQWSEHFQQVGFRIEGRTDTGRATAELLNMNARRRVQLRQELAIKLDPT